MLASYPKDRGFGPPHAKGTVGCQVQPHDCWSDSLAVLLVRLQPMESTGHGAGVLHIVSAYIPRAEWAGRMYGHADSVPMSRLRLLGADGVYRLQTTMHCKGGRWVNLYIWRAC